MEKEIKSLTKEQITAINMLLAKEQRVEIIPTERGIFIYKTHREKLKI